MNTYTRRRCQVSRIQSVTSSSTSRPSREFTSTVTAAKKKAQPVALSCQPAKPATAMAPAVITIGLSA